MKNNHKSYRIITVILISLLLSGCGADQDAPVSSYTSEPGTSNSSAVKPSTSNLSDGNTDEDVVTTAEPEAEADLGMEPGTITLDENSSLPSPSPSASPLSSPPASEMPESAPTPEVSEEPLEYHYPTDEESRLEEMEMYLEYCSTQATVETDKKACVVDVRTAENPYDVVWDYGPDYGGIVENAAWFKVFDADYYMEQFPMLAYQYHYDEDLLLQHFQTVGVHEGRQGNTRFNVADYMLKCPDDVKEMFGDCYAAYYFYWMNIETDRRMNVSGNGQPKQMTAVMTRMQKLEFDQVNKLRESKDLEPYVFDSELAMMGNFRAWIDATEDWELHEWLYANRQQASDFMKMIGSTSGGGENTVKHYSSFPMDWYYCYYHSKPHYDAMVSTDSTYFGCSNGYLGDCAHKGEGGIVMVEFDMFAIDLSTALNP